MQTTQIVRKPMTRDEALKIFNIEEPTPEKKLDVEQLLKVISKNQS